MIGFLSRRLALEKQSRWLIAMLCVGAIRDWAVFSVSAHQPASPQMIQRDELDERLVSLEREWKARAGKAESVKRAQDGRGKADAEFFELVLLLETRCKDRNVKFEIIEMISSDHASEFVKTAAPALVFALLRNGDRGGLVDMFSRRGFRHLSTAGDIELALAAAQKMPAPFLILCDAFDASVNASARKDLAAALRRALGPLGVNAVSDRQLVNDSRRWYREHKAEYTLNYSYEGWGPMVKRDGKLVNTAEGLFITKEEAKKREEGVIPESSEIK